LNNIKAANNGDKLGGTPIYVGFKVRLASNSPAVLVSHQSQTAAEFTVASAATTTTTGVAITPSISTNQVNSGSTSFSTGRSRPAQATAHDQILGGFNIRSFFSTRRGQQVLTNLERLADERAGDN
jgi:hypothetical protein